MQEPNTSDAAIHPAIVNLLKSLRTGDPHVHQDFALWPLFAEPRPLPAYITLVEALPLPGFRISEVSDGGSVPNLRVVNETADNVLLFDGEELKGAKQNRILNTTILVAAGTSLDVPVSCTERGRWSYNSPDFDASGSLAHAELRKKKAAAVACSLIHEKKHHSDQGAVWSEIEMLHTMAESSDHSRTRAMKDAYEGRQRELDEFTRAIPCLEGQCGLLAVTGDRVEGLDVISKPEAYARLHRRLVESHAMDFLVRKRGQAAKALDTRAPERFLAEAAAGTQSVHETPGLGQDHRLGFRWGYGAALRVDETVVHLALFGGSHGTPRHPAETPLRRHRRDF